MGLYNNCFQHVSYCVTLSWKNSGKKTSRERMEKMPRMERKTNKWDQINSSFISKLSGALFKIIEDIRPLNGAHCVWVGPECSFDGMLDFMKNSAGAGDKHRWIWRSILFVLPYRISQATIPSTSLLEEEIRIIGPPIRDHTTPAEAGQALMKPFTRKGWGIYSGVRLPIYSCVW